MKFRGKVTAALAVVIAVSLFALVSCGAKNNAEILSALSEKYPKALYLAEVIYDDVLPHEAEPSSGKYYAVSDDSEIQSINDLKNALGEVYTQSYIKVLENTALNGATSDDVSISGSCMSTRKRPSISASRPSLIFRRRRSRDRAASRLRSRSSATARLSTSCLRNTTASG